MTGTACSVKITNQSKCISKKDVSKASFFDILPRDESKSNFYLSSAEICGTLLICDLINYCEDGGRD